MKVAGNLLQTCCILTSSYARALPGEILGGGGGPIVIIIIIIIIITDLCSAFRSEDTEALKDTEALVRFYHYRNTI